MGISLTRYVQTRVHEVIDGMTPSSICIRGSYDRTHLVSRKEKIDKLENWQRPTAEIQGRTVILHCFPGTAHVFHHASLVATHLTLSDRDPGIVQMELPASEDCAAELRRGLTGLRPTAVAVLASGTAYLARGSAWRDHGSALSRVEAIGENSVTWIAVKHSFWGDIAGQLGRLLVETGFRTVIFVGKLGSMRPDDHPNQVLVTGSQSIVAGTEVQWVNPFQECLNGLKVGRHVTLPSVLQETVAWTEAARGSFDFVDPEIGHFAQGVTSAGGLFGYLHLVSDNLVAEFPHDLSNERERAIRQRREILYGVIRRKLKTLFARLPLAVV